MNECTFVGRLVKNPVLSQVGNTVVCNFSIYTTRSFKRGDGTYTKKREIIPLEAWDKGAELIASKFKQNNWIVVYTTAKNNYIPVQTVDGERKIMTIRFRVNSFEFPEWYDSSRESREEEAQYNNQDGNSNFSDELDYEFEEVGE